MSPLPWTLLPDQEIVRRDLHLQYGGRTQGGIGPSRQTPNVFLFSDPEVGERHGYIDSWKADGCYHYTGEGQRGDKEMKQGNAAVLRHKREGRALRLFRGVGGQIRYEDEFEVDDAQPFYTTDAPETGGGPIRSVIVFKLRPVNVSVPATAELPPPANNQVAEVPPEAGETERFFVEPSRETYEAERREAVLVQQFCLYLRRLGREVTRLRITPAGEAKPLFCDVYIKAEGLLIEAKGTVERGSIRMALGQLIDYGRFVDGGVRALLLPSLPRPDLVALIRSAGAGIYYPDGRGGFAYLGP